MRPEIDLVLLRDSLVELAETTYFGAALHKFTAQLIGVIDHVLKNMNAYPDVTVRLFTQHVGQSHQYLAGSTTKESPYEMAFCLEQAVGDWVKRDTIITTGLTYGQNFHFLNYDPWEFVKLSITGFDTKGYDLKLIFIGVPRLYIHKPLFCIPLFHELGHFVDFTLGVTQKSLLLIPSLYPSGPSSTSVPFPGSVPHFREHFADLFAACYIGRASIAPLETIAPNQPASPTHPATAARVRLVDEFLSGTNSDLIRLFQSALSTLAAPPLGLKFASPDIVDEFDDIRPYEVRNQQELYGLFAAAWQYLIDLLDKKRTAWASGVSAAKIEQIVNDLTEKSIRSYAIIQRWNRGSS